MRVLCCALLLVIACSGRPEPTPRVEETSAEANVYAALFESVMPPLRPGAIVVVDSTASLPAGFLSSRFGKRDSMPPELPATLDRLMQAKHPAAKLHFSRPVLLVPDTTLRAIFIAGGWTEFRRRYAGQHGFLRVSPVALSADSLDALVYYELRCGGLCGTGEALWISRRGTNRWHLRKRFHFWSS